MMRALVAVSCVVVVCAVCATTTVAYAQQSRGTSQIGQHAAHSMDETEKAKAAAGKSKTDDRAYNAALKNLPDKQYDPWHGVR